MLQHSSKERRADRRRFFEPDPSTAATMKKIAGTGSYADSRGPADMSLDAAKKYKDYGWALNWDSTARFPVRPQTLTDGASSTVACIPPMFHSKPWRTVARGVAADRRRRLWRELADVLRARPAGPAHERGLQDGVLRRDRLVVPAHQQDGRCCGHGVQQLPVRCVARLSLESGCVVEIPAIVLRRAGNLFEFGWNVKQAWPHKKVDCSPAATQVSRTTTLDLGCFPQDCGDDDCVDRPQTRPGCCVILNASWRRSMARR